MEQAEPLQSPAADVLLAARGAFRQLQREESFALEAVGDQVLSHGDQSGSIVKLLKQCIKDVVIVRVPESMMNTTQDLLNFHFLVGVPRVISIRVRGTVGDLSVELLVLVVDPVGIETYLTVAHSRPGRQVMHVPELPRADRLANPRTLVLSKPYIGQLICVLSGDWRMMFDLFRSADAPLSTKFLSAIWLMCPWVRDWMVKEFAVYTEPPQDVPWKFEPGDNEDTPDTATEFYCNLFYFFIGYMYRINDNIFHQVCKRFNTALVSANCAPVSQAIFNGAIVAKFTAGHQGDPNVTAAIGRAVATNQQGSYNQWISKDRLGTYEQLMGKSPFSPLDEQFFIQLRMVSTGFQQKSINLVIGLLPILDIVEDGATAELVAEFENARGLRVGLRNRPYTNVVRTIHPNFQISAIPRLVILAQAYYTRRDVNNGAESTWSKFKSSDSASSRLDMAEIETMKSLATALPRHRLDRIAGWAQSMEPTVIDTILENMDIKPERMYKYMVKNFLGGPWVRNYDSKHKSEYIKKELSERVAMLTMAINSAVVTHRAEDPNRAAEITDLGNRYKDAIQQTIAKLTTVYADPTGREDPKIAAANDLFDDLRQRAESHRLDGGWESFESRVARLTTEADGRRAAQAPMNRGIPAFFEQFKGHVEQLRDD